MLTVMSLGGSIVAPEGVNTAYLRDFRSLIYEILDSDSERRFLFVTGGGAPARNWQKAYREVVGGEANDADADWIGVAATRLNAALVKALFGKDCPLPVVENPTEPEVFAGRVMVAAGWKPGFSSDNDAVLLAERFAAPLVINLSNIEKVYTADPRTNPGARSLDTVSWDDFLKITGTEWKPGLNVPFDPVASLRAQKAGIRVICAKGTDIGNLRAILRGESFTGTTIGG